MNVIICHNWVITDRLTGSFDDQQPRDKMDSKEIRVLRITFSIWISCSSAQMSIIAPQFPFRRLRKGIWQCWVKRCAAKELILKKKGVELMKTTSKYFKKRIRAVRPTNTNTFHNWLALTLLAQQCGRVKGRLTFYCPSFSPTCLEMVFTANWKRWNQY